MLDVGALLRELASRHEASCLAIVVQAGRGSVRPGAKAIFDGLGARRGGDAVFSGELDKVLGEKAAAALAAGEPALVDVSDDACGSALKVYLEPQLGTRQVVVLGKGPVAAAVARVAEACGFEVRSVASGFESLEPPSRAAHVVVATGHEADEAALAHALRGVPSSVQLVASSRRAPAVLATLRQAGVPESKLALVRSPAGLDLGGDSPEEIALSIVAEIQAIRRGGSGRPLSEVKGAQAAPTAKGKTAKRTRLPLVEAAPVEDDGPMPPRTSWLPPPPPPRVPTIFTPNQARKPKVKFAMEDSEEYVEKSRHDDEDFRPDTPERLDDDEEKPAPRTSKSSERVTKRTRKRDDF